MNVNINNVLNLNFTNKKRKLITPSTRIYRTINRQRLFEMFENNKNTLVRPRCWKDKFENLALNSTILINGEKADFDFKDDVYCQCWSTSNASDAIWQIFSEGKDGIRIRSTVGTLLDSLIAETNVYPSISCFIGRVEYMTDGQLRQFAESHFKWGLGSDGKAIAETLLIKRNAFIHEKEVRLIYLSQDHTPIEKDCHHYTVDPHNLIDQIMIANTMS